MEIHSWAWQLGKHEFQVEIIQVNEGWIIDNGLKITTFIIICINTANQHLKPRILSIII